MIKIVVKKTPIILNGTKDVVGFDETVHVYMFKWLVKVTTIKFTAWETL